MEYRRVFITVKTYPTLSEKYDELVCTAGILDDGSWVRIYPLPFRKLDYEQRYKKYQWLELPIEKNLSDPRPESHKVTNIDHVTPIGEPVGTEQMWAERKRIIFEKNRIFTDLGKLIEAANSNELSMAIFKPVEILDLVVQDVSRDWDEEKLELLKLKAQQLDMFQSAEELRNEFLFVDKLPYKFSYKFVDSHGKQSTLMIEDWEIGMLYWNCLKQTNGNEKRALGLVKQKYLDEFSCKDLYLFLGTTRQFHGWAKNPFVIVGIFYPPMGTQIPLL